MPGLIGIVSKNGVDKQLLDQMTNSIKHEEFYRVEKYIESYFGIARVHLGTFNLEPQPIFNEGRSLCIFMDGKIYDYKEEINRLKEKGYKFSFKNDPEFCLHSYEEYGIDFVKNLNGSFVFVICNLKENKIIIANDRYGLRPLYYTMNNGKLMFASEIKAILEDKTFKKELNDRTVADFFAFGEVLGNKTFFKSIEVLPPASIFVYDGQNLSINQYWDFNYEPDYSKSEDEFVDELIKTFKRAVEIRMKDDLRYGISLSGGLDSRVVVGAIDKEKRRNVLLFSYGPLDCDEVKIAKKVSDVAGTKFQAIRITPEIIIDNAKRCIYLSDGLDYVGVSYIPPIHRIISNDIDVVFTGFMLDTGLSSMYLTKEIVNAKSDKELFNILSKKLRLFSDKELGKLFVDEYYNRMKEYPSSSFKEAFDKVRERYPGNKSNLFGFRNHARRKTLMGHILMRFAVEDLNPAFDNEFVNIIRTIPPELRLHYHIYRKFLKKLSPELARIPYNKTMVRVDAPLILWRVGVIYQQGKEKLKKSISKILKGKISLLNKRSYVNFDEWLRTNKKWKNYFRELLLSNETISTKKYFNQDYIKKLFQEHGDGNQSNSLKILYIASFELFLKLFMNDP